MSISKVTDGIYKLTTNVEDVLFEGLWDIPDGVSLNSFVVKGEKTALIDGFCGWDGVPETFFKMLDEMDLSIDSIDYIIINHMEPDHSGWIESIQNLKSDVKIFCSRAASGMLEAFYGQVENVHVVKHGETLDLGNGHVLEFVAAPGVHWPDTIFTFDHKTGTLFSCDAFGSYGKVEAKGYDDELDQEAIDFYEKEALRYYANIVAAFSKMVVNALKKTEHLDIKIIAPGHGIVWRKNPLKIVEDYIRYASYQEGPAKEKVTLLWGSMYGMTKAGVDKAVETLEKSGIEYDVINIMETSWGFILGSVWESTGVVLAMPTYENKMFPTMAAALEEIGKKTAKNRLAFRLGSYGWSGGAEKELAKIMEDTKLGWNFIPSVEFKGSAKAEDLEAIENGVLELVSKIKSSVHPECQVQEPAV